MIDTEAALAGRLRRMQWLATGLLVCMAVTFVLSSAYRDTFPALNIVWAFSEAALIGGLADWFAVTALFRHPLGLPIPHTAIVPNRKNEIGRALASFIGKHFLVREAVEARLLKINLAARLGQWLDQAQNSSRLSHDLGVALEWLMRAVDSAALRESMKGSVREALGRVPVNSALAILIDVLASGNHTRSLIDQLVQFGRDQLDHNRERIRTRIKDRSPWWLPKFVDEEIYGQMVGEFERILNEIGDDPMHPARAQFNDRLKQLRHTLQGDEKLIEKSEALRNEFLDHPAVREFFNDLWLKLRVFLLESLADPESKLRLGLENEMRAVGKTLVKDEEIAARLDLWLREAVIYIVENYRNQLSEIISDTIEQWDAAATSRRIELHIGRDLQFIRINGTVVGGLVGVALYLAWQALAA
jgi:uncharacterized membrane-anchored protein YjiN (DUF445 family)